MLSSLSLSRRRRDAWVAENLSAPHAIEQTPLASSRRHILLPSGNHHDNGVAAPLRRRRGRAPAPTPSSRVVIMITVKTVKGGGTGKRTTRAPRASPPSRSATARTPIYERAPLPWTSWPSSSFQEAAAAAAARVASWMATARADHQATGSGAASAAATAPGCRAASSRACRGRRSPARACLRLWGARSSPSVS